MDNVAQSVVLYVATTTFRSLEILELFSSFGHASLNLIGLAFELCDHRFGHVQTDPPLQERSSHCLAILLD